MIFEDDPYVALRFSGETLPTMLSLDRDDKVVYASSFSKTVCPGIRVGYLVGPAELIAAIAKRATNTYISPNMVAQSIVHEFCASGAIDRSIETVKAALAERRRRARRGARARTCPRRASRRPQGGYFMWVTLPEGTDVDAIFSAADERGVRVRQGHGLPARGRREHPAPRLLGRHGRPDRRGRPAPGRRGALRRRRAGGDRVAMSVGAAIAIGAVAGLALGIVVTCRHRRSPGA